MRQKVSELAELAAGMKEIRHRPGDRRHRVGLRDAVRTVLEAEKVVLETARKPDFDIDMLVDVWTRFEDSRNG